MEKIHGNSRNSPKKTYLYGLFDSFRSFLKWGITSQEDPERRYSRKFMADKELDIIDSSTRSEMLDKEKKLIQEHPGPLNKESWAGKNKK